MLVTKQKILRRFWYALMPMSVLEDGPRPFTLLGEPLVLWKGADGQPVALEDRCCHRTAKLSKGSIEDGRIVCAYHGWTFDASGACVRIPQAPDKPVPKACRVRAYACQEKYGYVWVALDDPLQPIPDFPEDGAPGYRRIFQFYQTWKTSPLRFMENAFDSAHFSYVHRANFGIYEQPRPSIYEIKEDAWGFEAHTVVPVKNPPAGHRVSGSTQPFIERHLYNRWYMPSVRRFGCIYADTGKHHIIYNCATPIDDSTIALAQWLYRNDDESDCSTEELIAWDAPIVEEDREILEATDFDACIDTARRAEQHMESDKPGLLMRRMMLELLRQHGEDEVYNERRA
ncbi:MAG: aromatic ring-hydroxylating dioxygenase subunit alpha [Pigmentiphaga sp.]|uniref:aromatic ring-hydroxylating dioxygenase subunit alpha n=1 Tax=Pigmentiphaga sp. TaxID=1977564 RepID=UPI0029B52322|nr:aromatic ring-hydroxylating dioxygenase subunit alpha [Pigmentiphaga sp.]MDX3905290.1 aromatic ring-hydroxylating dioxygenase subunit alpha [Pigmentiphaga sp.]